MVTDFTSDSSGAIKPETGTTSTFKAKTSFIRGYETTESVYTPKTKTTFTPDSYTSIPGYGVTGTTDIPKVDSTFTPDSYATIPGYGVTGTTVTPKSQTTFMPDINSTDIMGTTEDILPEGIDQKMCRNTSLIPCLSVRPKK